MLLLRSHVPVYFAPLAFAIDCVAKLLFIFEEITYLISIKKCKQHCSIMLLFLISVNVKHSCIKISTVYPDDRLDC